MNGYQKEQATLLRMKGLSEEEIADSLNLYRESEEEGITDYGTLKGKLRFYNSLTERHEEMRW